jgi:putative SOS response-associated peptidase YedK
MTMPLLPNYNVVPTQRSLIIRAGKTGPDSAMLRWGLVPSWTEDLSFGSRAINARSEDAATKPSFRAAWKSRRCLVPVSGFYEWRGGKGGKGKQPYHFTVTDSPVFAFAGLWERNEKAVPNEALETFTILTREPNELMAEFHSRMPCIVMAQDFVAWLDPNQNEPRADILAPFPSDRMSATPVSTWVNSPAHNDPRCVEPVAIATDEQSDAARDRGESEGSLFG